MSQKKRLVLSKKTIIIASGLVVVIGFIVINTIAQHNAVQTAKNGTSSADAPQFSTVLPNGQSISQLGGWNRISPPESDPVFAYTDTISTVSVNVSEQPLPETFKNDTDSQVADLAKKFNATNQIDNAGVKAYIGTSAKGPQSVLFAKNNLLILIKSQQKIADRDWANYIKSLN